MEQVHKGNRPTLGDLKKLNRLKWNGYRDVVLADNEESNKYVAAIMRELEITHDEINQQIFLIEDTKDVYESFYRIMDEKIKKNIEKAGLKKLVYGYEFQEFSFLSDAKNKCPNCKKNIFCEEHTLAR